MQLLRTGLLVISLVVTCLPAIAQPGAVRGIVRHADGQPAARVTLKVSGTDASTTTAADGRFLFTGLSPADHELIISLKNQKSFIRFVSVLAAKTTELDITLPATGNELDEVLVTGNTSAYSANQPSATLRLAEPLLEVPQNIQVVTRQLLADQQIFDMLDGATRNVSGVTRGEHWDTYARIYARGTNIPAFRNGMNVTMPWGPLTEDMSMVDRIEFIKGPAGFALANGGSGGFYNVVTKKPTGSTRGEASFTIGSYDLYRASLDLDGKLDTKAKLLYRLNIMGQRKNSFIRHDFNNRLSFAPVITYRPDDRTEISLEYNYQFSSMLATGAGYQFSAKEMADPMVPRDFTTAVPNIDPNDIKDHSVFANLQHRMNDQWKLTAQLAYFSSTQQGSSFWPSSIDSLGNLQRGVNNWDAYNENKLGQVFVNGELATGPLQHRIIAGLDAGNKQYTADWSQYFLVNGKQPFNIYRPDYSVPSDSLPVYDRSRSLRSRVPAYEQQSWTAIYLQDELRFFRERLRITLAGRYAYFNDHRSIQNTVVTPRIGISYSIDKHTAVYALYDGSFLPQPGTTSDLKPLTPVIGKNVEAGIKRDWAGGRWNSSLGIYRNIQDNLPVTDPNYPNQNFYLQIGQARTQGIEADVRGQLSKGLDLVLNYAYTDAIITRDGPGAANIGNVLPGTTRTVTNGWLTYRLSNGIMKGLGLSIGAQYQAGRYAWYVFDGGEQPLKDYFRMDGSISWQRSRFGAALNINNLLNAYLYSGACYNFSKYYYWVPEAPRNARLTITYKF